MHAGYEGEFDGDGGSGVMCPDGCGCWSRTGIRARVGAGVSREEAREEGLDMPFLLGGAEVGIVAVVGGGLDEGPECLVLLGLG
jgi:hypothetical protein